ncbi:MAG: hypothetical protein GY785_14145 [Gammaproteobacteria bacterium]|nr:hypothetical protein [Gammaproteobacteria bacterium]
MECLLQYLDDFDDLIGACGLVYERLRRLFLTLAALIISSAMTASGVLLALVHPPMALAICILLFVTLLYRIVTSPSPDRLQST